MPHAYFLVAHKWEDKFISGKIEWKDEQDTVKKIFGRLRWKRIVVEGVKLRVERWVGGKKMTKAEESKGIGNSWKWINSCHITFVFKMILLKMNSNKCLL